MKEKTLEKTFTEKEYSYYKNYSSFSKFKSPEEEYEWSKTQNKTCFKCNKILCLNDFKGNTSSSQPFASLTGLRFRRGECIECGKNISKGKNAAINEAKKLGINLTAPEGTSCEICNRTERIVFDHDHKSLIHRGWLCDTCNRALGMLSVAGDGSEIFGLIKSINYLLKTEIVFDSDSNQIKQINYDENIMDIEKV